MFEKPDPLLRPRDAAKRLGVCTETIWRWMRKGALAYVEVGPHHKKRILTSVCDSMLSVPRSTTTDDNQPHSDTTVFPA
jgi:predicted site-specific integrase-resolvase